jgi:hypothetical protein
MLLASLFLASITQESVPATPPPLPTRDDTIVARVPGSFLHVAIDIPEFSTENRNAAILKRIFGDRGVIIGAIPSRLVAIEVLAEREPDLKATNESWRTDNLSGSGARWNEFDAAGTACADLGVMLDGSGSHDYHAFFVRAGHRFDLHVGESTAKDRESVFSRASFVEILESVRMAVVRRGTWQQMPPGSITLMDEAIRRQNGWRALLLERMEAAQDDYAVWFGAAELSRHFELPPAELLPLYQRVIEIFQPRVEAKAILTAPENLALAASEDGLALALLDSDRTKEAIPHLERAFQVARDLTAPTRGGILYNLACAHARLGNAAVAIEKLIEAESQQSGCLARAHTDKDFDPIRESKRFQDLLNGDRGNY